MGLKIQVAELGQCLVLGGTIQGWDGYLHHCRRLGIEHVVANHGTASKNNDQPEEEGDHPCPSASVVGRGNIRRLLSAAVVGCQRTPGENFRHRTGGWAAVVHCLHRPRGILGGRQGQQGRGGLGFYTPALRAGVRSAYALEEDLRGALEGAARKVAHKLGRYLGAIATIASAAPLLGLFGTVIGMIEIFGSQSAASGAIGTGNPAQLAHGISVALYNTAFGLIIAIPALIFWRYFRGRVDEYLLNLELAGERFARHLNLLRK